MFQEKLSACSKNNKSFFHEFLEGNVSWEARHFTLLRQKQQRILGFYLAPTAYFRCNFVYLAKWVFDKKI